jgi:cyclopropane-fatty-acyl-phospholipid synthase
MTSDSQSLAAAGVILRELFGAPQQREFTTRLWDGSVEAPHADSRFTLIIRRPGALRRMLLPPRELAIAEAYLHDDIDIEGSVEAAAGLLETMMTRLASPAVLARVSAGLFSLPTDDAPDRLPRRSRAGTLAGKLHSRGRDAQAVRSHYDVGNDFYALWLGRRLVYSCAYFRTGEETIDAAQEAKLDLICRKLRLQPGEHLLDIGCGWGALVQFAAERYGVRATGITLSSPQAEVARERLAAAGLADRVQILVRDYRDMPRGEQFDKVVSVGMFEHVGRAKLPEYFTQACRLTRPGGLFLNHGIAECPDQHGRVASLAARFLFGRGTFIPTYVFPDGELVSSGDALQVAEGARLEPRDIESLREHYALTLRHWVSRLEAHRAEAVAAAGEETYRVWRLYMSASAHAFATGQITVMQMLFSKPDEAGNAHLPLTREDLYTEESLPAPVSM